jgi:hypothetical protein
MATLETLPRNAALRIFRHALGCGEERRP